MTRLEGWDDIIAIDGYEKECLGIREDGTVCYYGDNQFDQGEAIKDWKDIISVRLGKNFCVGLTGHGEAVISFSADYDGMKAERVVKAVQRWGYIRAIGTDGYNNIVVLRSDGSYNAVIK